jgi:hypothetical protein
MEENQMGELMSYTGPRSRAPNGVTGGGMAEGPRSVTPAAVTAGAGTMGRRIPGATTGTGPVFEFSDRHTGSPDRDDTGEAASILRGPADRQDPHRELHRRLVPVGGEPGPVRQHLLRGGPACLDDSRGSRSCETAGQEPGNGGPLRGLRDRPGQVDHLRAVEGGRSLGTGVDPQLRHPAGLVGADDPVQGQVASSGERGDRAAGLPGAPSGGHPSSRWARISVSTSS